MRRLIRPAAFTGISIAAIVGFVVAGRLSAERLNVNDWSGWLDRADPVDALAEIARWLGLGLAAYVAIVSFVALLAEIAAAVRMPRIHRWLHRLVGFVALPALRRRLLEFTTVATITAASLHTLPAGAAVAPAPIALVAESSGPAPLVSVRGEFHGFGVPTAAPAEVDPVGVHTVRRGETLGQIIIDQYGHFDAALLHDVVQANPQITDPNMILIGWTIVLPDVSPIAEAVPLTAVVRGEATWAVVTVQPGDTLWDIVDRHYGHATADLVWATVEANPGLDDPNLIYPGQQITLPPTTDQAPTVTQSVEPVPLPPSLVPEAPVATETSAPVIEAPSDPPGSSPDPATTGSTPTATWDAPMSAPSPNTIPVVVSAPATTPSIEVGDGSDISDEAVGPSLAQLIGWTGGAGLAAALLGLAARRRRRLPLAERVRRPSKRAIELGVALRETDNLSTVDWAAGALRTLATRLRPRPGESTPVPRLLRLAGDQIELVWDSPSTDAPAPWQSPDGGWSWTLDRTIELGAADNPNPCPCLVTIGRRGGADVLLNLESCGVLAITGTDEIVDALVRSIATELACSAFADAPTVLLVGGSRLPGEPDHARVAELSEAIGWLRDRSDSAGALLAHRRLTSLFALRARSRPQDGHEPVVVVVDPADMPDHDVATLVSLANGDLGAVVVVAGSHPSITWQLRCSSDSVDVEPLGLVLEPVGLDVSLDLLVAEIIPDADPEVDEASDETDSEIPELEHVLADHLQLVCVHEGDMAPTPEEGGDGDDEWDVELKVLGQVRSVGTKQPLTPTELHLAIYLAFHRNGENSDTIATMIWPNGAADRTITNTMASLRRKLGTGSDGGMLFPLGRDNQYIYRLSRRVVTDWDQFITLTKRSEGLPPDEAVALLDQALELIDGPPFRAATGYSWAYSDGTATLMIETVRAVARKCVQLHIDRSELLDAGAAACRGARADDASADDPLVAQVLKAFAHAGEDASADLLAARLGVGKADH